MFFTTPEAKARRDEKREAKRALIRWREAHPAENTMRGAAMFKPWPSSEYGITRFGPVLGATAEFFNADAHKGWTATRLVAGAATLGTSAFLTGRKNKGAASVVIVFANGDVRSFNVTGDSTNLIAAKQYTVAFNTLAAQLAAEQESAF
ncbi:hypothetical protein ACPYPG_08280 [Streptomyces sp. FR-108]|uniref:hypothetical protein n=1 Tax=Streptomyces sp. FR-108 TaxID=3416665 RepID=UPI003CF90867